MRPPRTHPRYLAFDEGPFTFDEPDAVVVGVLTRGAHTVEGIVQGTVTVDGWDATEVLVTLARRLPGAGPDAILVDGITLGGLNLVDLTAVATTLGRPVFGVTRKAPDRAAMARAVQQAPDPERRRDALPTQSPLPIIVAGRALHVQAAAPPAATLAAPDILAWLGPAMADAGIPEPLRLAHHIATAMVRGVSGTQP